MISETLKATGVVQCFLNDELVETSNLVVDGGKAWIAGRVTGNGAACSHMAVGTNGDTSAGNQITLKAESFRKALAVAGGEAAGAVVTFKATYGAGEATGTINEAGLFNQSSGGTMIARSVVGPYVKGANDVLSVVWTITIS